MLRLDICKKCYLVTSRCISLSQHHFIVCFVYLLVSFSLKHIKCQLSLPLSLSYRVQLCCQCSIMLSGLKSVVYFQLQDKMNVGQSVAICASTVLLLPTLILIVVLIIDVQCFINKSVAKYCSMYINKCVINLKLHLIKLCM